MPTSEQVQRFIALIDKDGSGTIDVKELMEAINDSGIDEKFIKEFIAEFDKDGDGCLNVNELKSFLEQCDL